MNHAIVSTLLLALAVVATAAPVRQLRQERPKGNLLSLATDKFVKLPPNGNVTADGQLVDEAAIYVKTIAGTNPQQITIESALSTPENVSFLIFEDGTFKSGSPLNGNEIFERVNVDTLVYALRVVNPTPPESGSGSISGSGESGDEAAVNHYLGFSKKTFEVGLYESIGPETKFKFYPNYE